ncbi:junctional adhesion molecule-like [Brevipalpus obovatus]|uniref:junctional adhesion molecule-like n=1 Tax=Brevipalpus obovatus TaxID=246614 RepID=UPI003D9E90CF
MSLMFLYSTVFIDCVSSSWPCFTCTQLFRTSLRMLSIFYLNWASTSLCLFVSILISSSSVTPSPTFSYFIPSLPQTAQRKDLLGQARSPRKPPSSRNQLRMLEERAVPKNITAQVGQSTYLHCIVETIGDKTVSWIRLQDFHLLTVGLDVHTSDPRFLIRYGTMQPNDWALQIKHVTQKDEGLYECQVNTDPPRSQYYYLSVLVPHSEMADSGKDMVVDTGSAINLTCIISRSSNAPSYVFWYYNDRMMNYNSELDGRGQVLLTKHPLKENTFISRLILRNARHNDSGNYSCSPVNVDSSSIYVHVLQREKQSSHNWVQNDDGGSNEYLNGGQMLLFSHIFCFSFCISHSFWCFFADL